MFKLLLHFDAGADVANGRNTTLGFTLTIELNGALAIDPKYRTIKTLKPVF